MVSWFAGLFYMPRLFVYHTEAQNKTDIEKKILSKEYTKSEKLLWSAIMNPACWLTLIFGSIMLYINPALLEQGWMQLKLVFVLALVIYHYLTRKIMLEIWEDKYRFTSTQLRFYNEGATIILFSTVFLVVLKNTVDWIWGVVGLIIFAVAIMVAVKIAKKVREAKS